ncbi:helix-turn-helix transcriptional regulator [Martelella lutilitoris]|uniref:helix-turn-helix transcriptional regulator n=1 Tax=Martelella lutilitoris TaxID=2583532 RepID=UPI00165173C3|nr:helix-turn-helix domain-containing protein [Martelella lutilitoris]
MNPNSSSVRANGAASLRTFAYPEKLLTTKEVATLTGLSTSFFHKRRIYGGGPKFLRLNAHSKVGAIRYRLPDVLDWLAAGECNTEGSDHV